MTNKYLLPASIMFSSLIIASAWVYSIGAQNVSQNSQNVKQTQESSKHTDIKTPGCGV